MQFFWVMQQGLVKKNGYELTGNQIHYECCVIATNNLILRLEDIKEI